jgi:hypothetical protein
MCAPSAWPLSALSATRCTTFAIWSLPPLPLLPCPALPPLTSRYAVRCDAMRCGAVCRAKPAARVGWAVVPPLVVWPKTRSITRWVVVTAKPVVADRPVRRGAGAPSSRLCSPVPSTLYACGHTLLVLFAGLPKVSRLATNAKSLLALFWCRAAVCRRV